MHLFLAFVIIVVLIGLGFGPIMRKFCLIGLAVVAVIAIILNTLPREDPFKPAQVSNSDCETPAHMAARKAAGGLLALAGSIPCAPDAPVLAERTDIYQQSLQILSGEKLTPLN